MCKVKYFNFDDEVNMRKVKYLLDFDDSCDFHRFSSLAAVKQCLCSGDFDPLYTVHVYIKASAPQGCFNALSAEFYVCDLLKKSASDISKACIHWCSVDEETFNA